MWGCAVRVTRGLGFAGAFLLVLGLAYGLTPVGRDCGSAFSPSDSFTTDAAACSVSLAGRTNTAWLLIGLGGALLVGVVGAAESLAAPKREPVEGSGQV